MNDEWVSLHEVFYGRFPPLTFLPFFKPTDCREPRQRKKDPRARLCHSLNFGYRTMSVLDEETGRVVYSRDVTWHHREAT